MACQIAEHDYVFVRGCNDKITGIVTASDLSHQFINDGSGFRDNWGDRIPPTKTVSTSTVGSPTKYVSVRHRTSYFPGFKAYMASAMKDPNKWKCLSSNIDVSGDEIARQLKCVNRIRDDVMHFKDKFSLKDGVLSPRRRLYITELSSVLSRLESLHGGERRASIGLSVNSVQFEPDLHEQVISQSIAGRL